MPSDWKTTLAGATGALALLAHTALDYAAAGQHSTGKLVAGCLASALLFAVGWAAKDAGT